MKAKVHITLKSGVLDPQGKAVEHALGGLGFKDIVDVRQGKYIELTLKTKDKDKAKVKAMSNRENCLKSSTTHCCLNALNCHL